MQQYQSAFKPGLFESSVALVTGGGTGIGRTTAHELASLGATVVLAGRRDAVLKRACQEIKQSNPTANFDYVVMNIRDEKSVEEAVKGVVSKWGKITHLVNNAGGQFLSPAENISPKGWKAVIDTNLNGTWMVTKAVFDCYMKEHGGVVVNVTMAMQNGFPLMTHSGAARAGVDNMTKSLAVEWGKYGVRINCVSPGTIIGNGMTNYPKQVHNQVISEYQKHNPLLRLGVESEVAAAIVFLLSPAASFVTGSTISVDGGNTLWRGFQSNKSGQESRVRAFTGYSNPDEAFGNDIPDIFKQAYIKYTSKL